MKYRGNFFQKGDHQYESREVIMGRAMKTIKLPMIIIIIIIITVAIILEAIAVLASSATATTTATAIATTTATPRRVAAPTVP
jgi:hypothetical protein